jgi:hypothetical protein
MGADLAVAGIWVVAAFTVAGLAVADSMVEWEGSVVPAWGACPAVVSAALAWERCRVVVLAALEWGLCRVEQSAAGPWVVWAVLAWGQWAARVAVREQRGLCGLGARGVQVLVEGWEAHSLDDILPAA